MSFEIKRENAGGYILLDNGMQVDAFFSRAEAKEYLGQIAADGLEAIERERKLLDEQEKECLDALKLANEED